MMKRMQLVLSVFLVAALGAYGFTQGTNSNEAAQAPSPERYVIREAKIIAKLKLSKQQMAEYQAMEAWLRAESVNLKERNLANIERGGNLNAERGKRMKKILTPAQHEMYLSAWGIGREYGGAYSSPSGKFFEGADELILKAIGLTQKQWDEYNDLQKEVEKENAAMHSLGKADTNAARAKGAETYKLVNRRMAKILTPEQYQEWVDRWGDIMIPLLNGTDASTRRIPALLQQGGDGRIAGKSGGK